MLAVGTWNLEDPFLPDDCAGAEEEAASDAKFTWLSGVIGHLAPVLAVREVGDHAALDDLRARHGQAPGQPDRR